MRSDADPKAIHSRGHMGRMPLGPDESIAFPHNRQQPTEDPRDGCPGAWYRTRFVVSIAPFLRRRVDGGMRVPNLLLERSDDELLIALVSIAEDEQERFESWRSSVVWG